MSGSDMLAKTGAVREIMALLDDTQSGDCHELADHPVNITPGKTLVTQLNIYAKDTHPEYSPLREDFVELFLQPEKGSPFTEICGRISRRRLTFVEPFEPNSKGRTVLELLALACEIPVLLWFSFEGKIDVGVPVEGDMIRTKGRLYCEPGFAYGEFFSPVKADIIETRMLKRDKRKHEVQDWGILKLRLRTDINRFDLVGDNLKEGGEFVWISDYNPPLSFWEAYLRRVYGGRRWKKVWKKTIRSD